MIADFTARARPLVPGLGLAVILAMAAQFLSDHYGAPVMLMAILLGMPFHFLTEDTRTKLGIDFAARALLRTGVALLGLRVSLDMVRDIGWGFVALIAVSIAAVILISVALVPRLGRDRAFGLLTGGSVAICGASAAMAIASVLPPRDTAERDLSFTVITVTALSTLAMIVYPILAGAIGLNEELTGLFLGATIHDVAQVVGAGYSVSDETGDIATVVKLIRVTMLAPVVLIAALALRRANPQSTGRRPPLLPAFVLGFLVLAALNSAHVVPAPVTDVASSLSRALLVAAVAAVGMKTSLARLADVGASAIMLLVLQTAGLAVLILSALALGIA
ncbi:putative sulfate exporter family transporter [Paracoccus sp. 1_MG-2023]|uniref:YeiH family protein n=1 Tax=unclassified Paracoccus (in: a-proteobacteria) TaxID=2688777 RepID=UPI001C0844E7|nr:MULTISPECIES: putative sulfate exporter family transporter [unclassified Paracoccus (in: a-proteobacteria)]MBU2958315.1 putative sulfate exporter family transporter [Paracoccus sp. C2R09]MDO6668442.1 putative sulfate exporter family transporter [Paracoccus sp. 1_MG-2023]